MDPLNVPQRYIPKILSTGDTKKQKKNLRKSRKLYKKGIYYERPKVKSFKSKPSPHIKNAQKIYKVDKISPSAELAEKTQCSQDALEKIVNKGRGAYYSSGSRPNQTAESWGIARLASAITGGNSSIVDYHILHDGCKPTSKALQMANKTCKKQNKCQKYFMKGGYSNIEDITRFYDNNIKHYEMFNETKDKAHLHIIAENLEKELSGPMELVLITIVNRLSLNNKLEFKPAYINHETVINVLIFLIKKDIDDIKKFLKHDESISPIRSLDATDITPDLRNEKELYLEELNKLKNALKKMNIFNKPQEFELKDTPQELTQILEESKPIIYAFYFMLDAFRTWYMLKIKHMSSAEFIDKYNDADIQFPNTFEK